MSQAWFRRTLVLSVTQCPMKHLLTSDSPEDSSANSPQRLEDPSRDREDLECRLHLLEDTVPANRIKNVCS